MRQLFVSISAALLVITGCGGGVEGTGADRTVLNPGTKIGDLSASEIEASCNTLRQQAFDSIVGPGACNYLALIQTYYWVWYQPDGGVIPTPLDFSTPAKSTALCELAKSNCRQGYKDVTFEDRCGDDVAENQCVLEDENFRNRCNVPIGMLLECVQETLQNTTALNDAAKCSDSYNYQRAQVDLDRVNDGEISEEQAFKFDPFPKFDSPACDKIEKQCGFNIIDFSNCNPRFVGSTN